MPPTEILSTRRRAFKAATLPEASKAGGKKTFKEMWKRVAAAIYLSKKWLLLYI
jgi:hypothetical protein